MKVRSGRGDHAKETAERNRAMILDYFQKNPNSTQADCSRALNLSPNTVSKHLKQIEGTITKKD